MPQPLGYHALAYIDMKGLLQKQFSQDKCDNVKGTGLVKNHIVTNQPVIEWCDKYGSGVIKHQFNFFNLVWKQLHEENLQGGRQTDIQIISFILHKSLNFLL